jgi:signal transduction histidine kinase
MMRGLFASLRLRLWLLVFLALIPALGMMFYTASEHGQHTAREVQDQALRLAQLVSSDQERRIEGARHLLVVMAHVPDVRERAATECQTFLSTLLAGNPLYANFGLADRTGEIICSAVPLDEPVNVADRAYFLGAIEARDFAIGEYQIGRVTHRATINFGYPILADDGHVQAVIYAAMDLSWLNHLLADVELPEGAVLMVIDRSGKILARSPNPELWVGESGLNDPLFQAMLAQGQGTAELRGMDGMARFYAFTGLRGLSGAGYVSIGIPRAIAYAPARRVLWRNLVFLSLVGVLSVAAVWVGGDVFVLRRLQALVQTTKRLSAGDLKARSGLPHGPGELGQLAAAFDDMAVCFEQNQTQQRLEEQLRRQNEALEEENHRVQELNRLKSEFVSLVSHELRTPLTAMTGSLDLLLEDGGDQSAAKPRQLLSIVKKNADRLVKLIDDLLDLSRLESGKFELRTTTVDIGALITEVASLLQPQIEAKGQQLTLDQSEALPFVTGDAERIRQILLNLLSNAHKYTPPGGQIWVMTRDEGEQVRIDVRDNGVGLSADEQARLFDKFFRAQHPATQEVAGTGLGLAITRSLVEMQGGQITVISAPGQGATFSFTLPAARHPQKTMVTE